MNITIFGRVRDKLRVEHKIVITQTDIEEMIVAKAKEKGIEGYEGRIWKHYDEIITGVVIDD